MKTPLILSLIILSGIFFSTCKKREILIPVCNTTSTTTYTGSASAILKNSCEGSSCHSSGAKSFELTTYDHFVPYINSGDFARAVFDEQSMPKKTKNALSQDGINILKCWADSGYPES